MCHDNPVFWGEVAPCEHLVQLYDSDTVFLDTLQGFVAGGLRTGDGVVIVATDGHRTALADRLEAEGFDLDAARRGDRYIDLDAQDTLEQFMVDGWPDEGQFHSVIRGVLTRARAGERPVRVFGEMVALMWARGEHGAVVHLEHLWHQLCASDGFSLFCAYPKAGFTSDQQQSIDAICAAHSRVISRIAPAR